MIKLKSIYFLGDYFINLAAIDIGETTIKIATWKDGKLQNKHAVDTPQELEQFYKLLTDEVNKIKKDTPIEGVAISSPGAVDQKTGIIGGISALPYIHNFNIVAELEKRFELSVSIENDANSAALGELAQGAHVVTNEFYNNFINFTGSGITIGLIIFTLVAASTYLVIKTGIVLPLNGVAAPWTTPAVISGFLIGSWKMAIWQFCTLLISTIIYWPFARKYDKVLLAKEQKEAKANS